MRMPRRPSDRLPEAPRKTAKRNGSSDMTETNANKQAARSLASVSLPRAEPEAAGMSSTRLGRVVTALNAAIEAGQLPGAVVAVARRGTWFYMKPLATSARTETPQCRAKLCSPSRP
jgi:hypothetical protein